MAKIGRLTDHRGRTDLGFVKIRNHLLERFPKWWLPDEFVFIDSIPKTTGKFDKKMLRDEFRGQHSVLPVDE